MIWWPVGIVLMLGGVVAALQLRTSRDDRSPAQVVADATGAPAWQAHFGGDDTDPIGGPTAGAADLDAAWDDVQRVLGPMPRTRRIVLTDAEVDERFRVFERDMANEIRRRQREGQ